MAEKVPLLYLYWGSGLNGSEFMTLALSILWMWVIRVGFASAFWRCPKHGPFSATGLTRRCPVVSSVGV